MATLVDIKQKIDNLFKVKEFGPDPQMLMFLPRVYDPLKFNWKNYFDADFVENLNGLMIRGADKVQRVFLASFPSIDVIERFIQEGHKGDLLFSHHPVYMECGDPKGSFGKGWQAIPFNLLEKMKKKELSFYSCHGPMDNNRELGTRSAMMKAIDAKFEEDFFFDGTGFHGAICSIEPTTSDKLISKLAKIYDIPYVDAAGAKGKKVSRIALIAGGADNVDSMKLAESKKVDAYIAGEIYTRLNTEWGKENNPRVTEFINSTNMTMIGLSHSASEFLTMKTEMQKWFQNNFQLNTTLLPQNKWWK